MSSPVHLEGNQLTIARIGAKVVDPSKVSGKATGVWTNVFSKLSDGNFLNTMGDSPKECPGEPADVNAASADLLAGKTVSVWVTLSSDGDKDLVGVYVGPAEVRGGEGPFHHRGAEP